MPLIESEGYEVTRQRLMLDPIIIAMAEELKAANYPKHKMYHIDDNKPSVAVMTAKGSVHIEQRVPRVPIFEFMMNSNGEYRNRGGKDGGAMGDIAHALIRLVEQDVR